MSEAVIFHIGAFLVAITLLLVPPFPSICMSVINQSTVKTLRDRPVDLNITDTDNSDVFFLVLA